MKALELYLKSAETGNKFAQYNLGRCYQRNNTLKAIKWYKKALENGYDDAKIPLNNLLDRDDHGLNRTEPLFSSNEPARTDEPN